jgi:hypothetical protein
MYRYQLLAFAIASGLFSYSQNDIDAIRYSRIGGGGSSRFIAMGGAFGAIGADPSCAAYNPAGLGLIRKGELSFSGGLRISNNEGTIYKTSTSLPDAKFTFNNFAFAYAWSPVKDPDSRNVIAFTNTQLQNFSSSVRMSGYTNSSSIARDMWNIASQSGPDNLNYFYEGLAFETAVLDTINGQFISLVDPKRTVKQTRDLVTSGRVNDLNFSYAYSYKDKFYIGGSLGFPRVEYTSTTTHTEVDDKDSMRIAFDTSSYTTTYVDGIPALNGFYENLLGFNSLEYTEYFKTQGTGFNFKIGGIARLNDMVRVGLYYHTPTIYNLSDTYYNSMSASFDKDKSYNYTSRNPLAEDGDGFFEYKVITPSRFGVNSAFIIQKMAVIGLDYELVNYRKAQLSSDKLSDFAGVNSVIKTKYSHGHNVRIGGELNIKPVMIRAGYAMQGSPFGDVFTGSFVRHTVSAGLGFRGSGQWYFDLVLAKTFSKEDYFPFTTLPTKATINYNATTLAATIGLKF